MEDVTIVWSFRNRLELLKRSIKSADETTPKSVNFCLVDASSNDITIKELRVFCNTIENRKIRICESAYRTTLSEAWNLGIMLSTTKYVVFASSDVHFLTAGWFELIKEGITNHSKYLLLQNHSVFMIDRDIIPIMGWFDESFKLGPHFDVDFMIRASEHNIGVDNYYNINGLYSHDSSDVIPDSTTNLDYRVANEVEDSLPMNDNHNEIIFKNKWESSWPGWTPNNTPHPPTHISQIRRKTPEIDPHPEYSKKYIK